MKSITISGIRDEQEFDQALSRLREQPLSGYVVYARVPEGCVGTNSAKLDAAELKLTEISSPPGSSSEQFELIDRAFRQGSCFNVALCCQAVIAPDAFTLIDWFQERHVDDYLCMCLFNPASRDALWRFVSESREFSPLCWCCGVEIWNYWLKPVWPSNGTDWHRAVTDLLRLNQYLRVLAPMSSRAWEVGQSSPGLEIGFVATNSEDERRHLNYSLFRL